MENIYYLICFRIKLKIWRVTACFMKRGLASSAGSDVPREIAWYADVCGCDPTVWQHSFMGTGYEIISSAIHPLRLFRVGLVVSYWPKDVH